MYMIRRSGTAFLKVIKSGIVSTLSANVINKMVSMISTMIITRLLTTNEYGIWSYVLNIYSYLALVTGLGLISGALQFGTENMGEGRAYAFYRYCYKKGLLFDVILIITVGFVISFLNLPIEGAKPYVVAILPILLAEYIITMGQSMLRAKNRIRQYAAALNVNSVAIAVGTCCGAFFSVRGVIAGRYLACIITIIVEYKLLAQDINKTFSAGQLETDEKNRLWHYSLFTGASSAMNCLVYSLDVTLIAVMVKNAVDVGIYRVGTVIPNALQFIPGSIVIAILPTVIYHRHEADWIKKNLKKAYLGLFACNACICLILIICAPLVIRIVSGEKYMLAVPILRILAMGYFFSGTFRGLSVNVLAAFRRVHYGLFISVVSCILDIVLNYFLILEFGMIGSAYATLLVDIVTAALSFFYVFFLIKKGTMDECT